MWCICLHVLCHIICKLWLHSFYEPLQNLQQDETKTDADFLLNNQILEKIEKKKRFMIFPKFYPSSPRPNLGHVHSCSSNGEKLTRLWEHNGGCPPAPQTPHIDGAVWQARMPNNSIKQKRRQERGAQTEEREKGREERRQENRGGRGLVAVRPRRHPADVWREATETQNKKKRELICDVLTGIPASKATEGSEGKLRARGSLPQRHTLTHTHLKGPYRCFHLFYFQAACDFP